IEAWSNADAPIFVNFTGPSITTTGLRANGINGFSRSGNVNILSTGTIDTNGSNAFGILADSGTTVSGTTFNGAPGTENITVTPLAVLGGSIVVQTSGSITTRGDESAGIWASPTTGSVLVNATVIFPPRDSS